MKPVYILLLGLIFFAGCSSNLYINDGVIRTENGSAIYTQNNDVPTATHKEHALFEGNAYLISGHYLFASGETISFVGCTQDKNIHFEDFILTLQATPFDVHFYENPTISINGSLVNVINRNRNFADNSSLIIYSGSTITNNGTLIFHNSIYGGNNIEGELLISTELILKTNTCYLFSITNNDGNNIDTSYNFLWHDSQ